MTAVPRDQLIDMLAQISTDNAELGDLMDYYKEGQEQHYSTMTDDELAQEFIELMEPISDDGDDFDPDDDSVVDNDNEFVDNDNDNDDEEDVF